MRTLPISYTPASNRFYKEKAVERKVKKEQTKLNNEKRIKRTLGNAALFSLVMATLYFIVKHHVRLSTLQADNRLRDRIAQEDIYKLL